jgi:hypothetical protein
MTFTRNTRCLCYTLTSTGKKYSHFVNCCHDQKRSCVTLFKMIRIVILTHSNSSPFTSRHHLGFSTRMDEPMLLPPPVTLRLHCCMCNDAQKRTRKRHWSSLYKMFSTELWMNHKRNKEKLTLLQHRHEISAASSSGNNDFLRSKHHDSTYTTLFTTCNF